MNSILVFGGCGAVLIITLVSCIIMTTGCYKKDKKAKKRTYAPSKPHLYQPYAVDTMTLVSYAVLITQTYNCMLLDSRLRCI